ncbi:hypothetical protein HAX54_025444, partial [Datura stramonium]|nr:hypothetical protein [Datura stramonium]
MMEVVSYPFDKASRLFRKVFFVEEKIVFLNGGGILQKGISDTITFPIEVGKLNIPLLYLLANFVDHILQPPRQSCCPIDHFDDDHRVQLHFN